MAEDIYQDIIGGKGPSINRNPSEESNSKSKGGSSGGGYGGGSDYGGGSYNGGSSGGGSSSGDYSGGSGYSGGGTDYSNYGTDASQQATTVTVPDEIRSAQYWYGEKAKFEANPYVNSENPGYQNPDGFDKNTVDMIYQDLESKVSNSGGNWYEAPGYSENDPTWKMIEWQYQQNHPVETPPATGQTGAAFQDQPLQDQPLQESQAPQTPTGTETSAPTAAVQTPTPAPTAQPTAAPVSSTPTVAQSVAPTPELTATPIYKQAVDAYKSLGMDDNKAQELALQAAYDQQQMEAKSEGILRGVNWKGIGSMVGNAIAQTANDLTKNVIDMEADILGIGLTKGARDAGDTAGVTFNRDRYFDLMDQGYQLYQQQVSEGNQPPMSNKDFAEKYAEYMFRVESNDRYNPNIDLTDFAQYMPEGTVDISGNARLEHSDDYEGNPVNAEPKADPQKQALIDSVQSYIYSNDSELSNNLDSIMNGAEQTESKPLSQAEMDEIILHLVESNPTEAMKSFIDFDKTGSMNELDTWMKQAYYYFIPGTQSIEGSNETLEKATKPFVTSVMSAGLMANIGEMAGSVIGGPVGGKVGKVLGFVLSFGINYAEQLGLVDLPYYDQIMEFFDKGADAVESTIGRYSLAFEDALGYAPFQDAGDYYRDLRNALSYRDLIKSSWTQNEKEYDPEVWDIIGPVAADLGVNIGGSRFTNTFMNATLGIDEALHGGNPEDVMLNDANEVYRFNLGQSEKVTLDSTPNERYRNMLETAQLLHDMGMSRAGIEAWRDRTVAELMGSNAFISEIHYNELTDPLNLLEGQQANTLYGIGALTGDTNLKTAARANGALDAGATVMGLLPSGMDTVVTQIAKFMGDEVHHAGGFNEVMETYNTENQFGNLEDVTAFGKHYSGINKEGKVSGWEPQMQEGLTVGDTIKNKINNFVSRTDDTRVLYLTDVSNTMINMGLANAKGDPVKITAFLDQLQNPSLILPGDPLYDISQSAIFNTYKEDVAQAVSNNRAKLDAILRQWSEFEDNRKALNALSEKLGMKPDKIIDLAENNKYNLAKQIELKAVQDPSILLGTDSADALIEKLTPFIKTEKHQYRTPWNPTELAFQISNAIGDGMQQVMLDKYNIQEKKTIYRVADAVKASQNFVFLGLSGTYLMNNILNNVVTRGLTGVGGFSFGKTMDKYFNRMGIRSERFGDSVAMEIGQKSSGEKTQYARMQEALSAKREAISDGSQFKKSLKAIKKSANEINQKLGVFAKMSGKIEEAESKQAIYSGTKQYMDRTWKPGVNLTRMPGVLEQALDAQKPGMKNAIYSAVGHGLNMDEINKSVMGDYVQPGLKQSFIDAASERYGANAENIVEQLLDKTGLLDELKDTLEGKDEAGRQKVFEAFQKTLEIENSAQVADHLVDVAESIKNDVTLQGFVGALEHASDMVDVDLATRLGTMNQWDKEFTLRLREPFTAKEWRQRVTDLQQKIDTQYQQLYAEKKQIWDGILTGLGMDDKYKTEYIKALTKITNLWESFQTGDKNTKGQHQLFAEYRAKAAFIKGEDPDGWQLRARTAWSEYLDGMAALYDAQAKAEMEAMEAMDKAFSDGMKAVTGRGDELAFIDDMQAQVRQLRQQEIDLNKQIRQQERTLETYSERDFLYEKNEAQRKQFRLDVAKIQKEMYEKLKPFQAAAIGLANDPNSVDYTAIVQADIAHEEAQKMRAAAEKYSDRAWEKISKDNENVTPEFLNINDAPTITEAEDLFARIDNRLKGTEGYNADDLLAMIYTAAGLSDEEVKPESLMSMMAQLSDDEITDIMTLSARYGTSVVAEMALSDDIETVARKISYRVYPKVVVTDKNDAGQKEYRKNVNKQRRELYNNIRALTQDIVKNAQASDNDLFAKVNQHITAEDWQTLNEVASKYNAILNELNTPPQPDPSRFTTEQLQKPEIYGNYNIVARVYDGDKVIALVPDKMSLTEINYSDDITFQVLGISPDDPEGIVYMAGDEPRVASPKAFQPEPNEAGSTAYNPAMDVNSTPALDPYAMANQEMLYKDVLPLLKNVQDQYETDLLHAQTMKLSDLDDVTRGLVKSYLDNVVAKDLSNAKYKAMRYGEMMRDIALLNYSDRYGFDNFLSMVAPYQFWLTRSANQWMKRMISHPRLYSHYQRIKDLEEKNEKEYLPSRLEGKIGIPMVGWPSYLGGRTFFNPSQLMPLSNILGQVEQMDDDKHVAEKKALTLLEEWRESEQITYDEFIQAQNKEGPVWDMAYAEASMGEDLDPSIGSLWQQYFSFSLPVNWIKAYVEESGNKLAHFPSTNVGNALSQLIARVNPDNEKAQRIAEVTREATSLPERALRKAFGFDYNEFGAYGDSLIARRMRAMLTDGEISKTDFDTAWLEKDGNPIYEKAVQDVREEQALKVPGYGAIAGIEDLFKDDGVSTKEKWAKVLLQIGLSPFGQYPFAEGEEKERRSYPERSQAYEDQASGVNPNAVTEYYDKYPAASTYTVTNKNSEDLQNRYALYDIIKEKYYDLDEYQRKDVQIQLGPKFYDAIINKETRAIETMPIEDLVAYARALNGTSPYLNLPFVDEQKVPEMKITPTDNSVLGQVKDYYDYKNEHFPGISTANNYYYSLEDKKSKDEFLRAFPTLKQYWDWNKQWKEEHQDASSWISSWSAYNDYKYAAPVWDALPNVVKGMIIDDTYKDEILDYFIGNAMDEAGIEGSKHDVTRDDLKGYAYTIIGVE